MIISGREIVFFRGNIVAKKLKHFFFQSVWQRFDMLTIIVFAQNIGKKARILKVKTIL